ncbi:dihydroneopterin aldolase [Xanthobacteraceae bacterium Astr-EGSB]|uniref:dihydroneopterin aldolase n=1 Tax=Astrobacterium formosum TaxID=3069710 RepID=UPI0027B053BB|nr:dihydroneopterin aldolase [Xanthobacteraceae bacterium Astr-EGSB]
MSDAIFVTGLLVHAHHGVMEHEEKVGQRFVIDIELELDLATAAASDRLVDTVSYSALVEVATQAFTNRNFRLVEAAAGAIADAVLSAFPRAAAVKVTVHKPHAPVAAIFTDVGVSILRRRHG